MKKFFVSEALLKQILARLEFGGPEWERDAVIKALRAALEQPGVQPVAWLHEWAGGEKIPLLHGRLDLDDDEPERVTPLFAAPHPQQPAPVQGPVTTEPPFGSKRKAAMAVYAPPFSFKHGYIFDSQNLMVADDDKVEGAVASRVRGWGRLGYLPNGAEVQDEIGQMIADALNAYYASHQAQQPAPVQEPVANTVKGAIMGAAYDFRDAHISGSTNLKRTAHAALEAAVDAALKTAPVQEKS